MTGSSGQHTSGNDENSAAESTPLSEKNQSEQKATKEMILDML
jgi:hypothetical protein